VIMYKNAKISLSFIFILLFFPCISYAGQFTVTRVYDGDTVKAIGHDIEIKVRLVGIDTPETSKKKNEEGQPYSDKATKHLAGLVLNKTVDVKGYGTDRYGRILGVITVDGINVNLEMVKVGLAEVYRGRPPKNFDVTPYQEAQGDAQEALRGTWMLGDEYISPMDWRKSQ